MSKISINMLLFYPLDSNNIFLADSFCNIFTSNQAFWNDFFPVDLRLAINNYEVARFIEKREVHGEHYIYILMPWLRKQRNTNTVCKNPFKYTCLILTLPHKYWGKTVSHGRSRFDLHCSNGIASLLWWRIMTYARRCVHI